MVIRKTSNPSGLTHFILFIIILICCAWLLRVEQGFAAFTVSVSPYEGGLDVRFGKVTSGTRASKEVSVSTTSDIGTQYRVVQTYAALTNTTGSSLTTDALQVYTLRGSNAVGTLGYDVESSVFLGPMTLFTSDAAGRSDSFVVVYNIDVPADQEPGLYRGRLIYSLEPIGSSSQSPITKSLNISVEVGASASFDVAATTGSNVVTLKSSNGEQTRIAELSVKLTGFLGSRYRIIQRSSRELISETGKPLTDSAVALRVRGGEHGQLGISELDALPASDVVLYTSDMQGSPDEIILTFALEDPNQEAGLYRGALIYTIESDTPLRQSEMVQTMPIEVDITPLFNLVVTTDKSGRIAFTDLKPEKPPQRSVSYIEVQTNSDKQYQVVQKVTGLLTNTEGHTIPQGFFKLKTISDADAEGGGYAREVPVEEGQMVLFTSPDGKPSQFKVIYTLTIPRDLKAGNYGTGITYSLLEM
ncbi:hypothetical protein ACFL1E_06435 [Candidatus Omnitrophota bacterium]